MKEGMNLIRIDEHTTEADIRDWQKRGRAEAEKNLNELFGAKIKELSKLISDLHTQTLISGSFISISHTLSSTAEVTLQYRETLEVAQSLNAKMRELRAHFAVLKPAILELNDKLADSLVKGLEARDTFLAEIKKNQPPPTPGTMN